MDVKDITVYYHYRHPSSYIFTGHRHGEWEINVILSGCMEITASDRVERLYKNRAILISTGELHQNRVVGGECAEMLVAHFTPSDKNELTPGVYDLGPDALSLLSLFVKDAERDGLSEDSTRVFSSDAKKLFEVLLSEIERSGSAEWSDGTKGALTYRCAVEYMRKNIDKPLGIEKIARASGVCATTLKKLFAYYTGMGCMRYFGEMKLESARAMLAKGASCASVSESLGFSSQAYFSKKYKELYGVPPSRERKT